VSHHQADHVDVDAAVEQLAQPLLGHEHLLLDRRPLPVPRKRQLPDRPLGGKEVQPLRDRVEDGQRDLEAEQREAYAHDPEAVVGP